MEKLCFVAENILYPAVMLGFVISHVVTVEIKKEALLLERISYNNLRIVHTRNLSRTCSFFSSHQCKKCLISWLKS